MVHMYIYYIYIYIYSIYIVYVNLVHWYFLTVNGSWLTCKTDECSKIMKGEAGYIC